MNDLVRSESAITNKTINKAIADLDGVKSIKFLTFNLANEEYGITISKVIEIIGVMPTVSIPRLPHYFKGVINLRGRIIPVMDLRLKLGMPAKENTNETVIIIVQSMNRRMGLLADRVTEVLDILSEEIEEAPEMGTDIDDKFIMGIGKKNNSIKILLDIDKVLETDSIQPLNGEIHIGENIN